jgi:hypothetical protein
VPTLRTPFPAGEGGGGGWGLRFTDWERSDPRLFFRPMDGRSLGWARMAPPLSPEGREPPRTYWGRSGTIPADTTAAEYRVRDAQAKGSGHRNRHDAAPGRDSVPWLAATRRRADCGSGQVPGSEARTSRVPLALTITVVRRVFCPPHQMEVILERTSEFVERIAALRAAVV